MLGASISEPIATCTYCPSRTTENEAAARPAAGVVGVGVAEHGQAVVALDDLELAALDARERLERRAGGGTTARAVAVGRVAELVGHREPHLTAATAAGQHRHSLGAA